MELKEIIETEIQDSNVAELSHELTNRGVPAGPVMTIPEILEHPVIMESGLIAKFEGARGVGRDIQILRTGTKINGTRPSVKAPPPELGQHNTEVFGKLGVDQATLLKLKNSGVI